MLRANLLSACQRNDVYRFREITKVPDWVEKGEINEYVYVLDTQMYNKCLLPRTSFLCITSEHASAEFVEQLLKHGAKTEVCDGLNDNPLHKACRSAIDPLRKIHLLFHYDKELHRKTNRNNTAPIHVAATKSESTICAELLQNGADINLVTNELLTPLHIASEHASSEFIEQLLKNGAITGLCDELNENALHKACHSAIDPLRKVQLLLQYDNELHRKTNRNNMAPIHVAAKNVDPAICAELLQHGADINLVTNKQLTPLHIASHFGRKEVVKVLLNHASVDVNLQDIKGDTPLHNAAGRGYTEIMNLLKSHPGCIPFLTNNEGRTADQKFPINLELLDAAQRDSSYQVKSLLDRGALCMKDENGNTPLHKACSSTVDSFEKVKLLINADRTQLHTPTNGKTFPMHLAAKNNDKRVLEYLIPRSQLNLRTANKHTPLHVAAMFGKTRNVELLCSLSDIDVNAQNLDGNTPAHLASRREHRNVLAILQKHPKYNEYIVNNKGETAVKDKPIDTVLLVMAEHNTVDVVNKVVSAGAKINTKDEFGNTVLHKACVSNLQSIEKCELFLEKEPELINIPNNKEEVPLHVAIRRFDSQVTRFLLECPNIDVNKRNKSKHAPLHIAVIRNNEDNTKALLKHPNIQISLQDNRAETACHIAATYKRTNLLRMLQSRPDCITKVRNIDAKIPSQIWCPYGAVTDLTEDVHLEWYQHKAVAVEPIYLFNRITLINGNIYHCPAEPYISVYNHELEEIERIHTDDVVNDVAELNSAQLVIAQANGLYLRSATGDVKRITSGPHYSVTTHNNIIYATTWPDDNPTVIYVYENINDTWQERHTISLPCTSDHIVTLQVTSTAIYECCLYERKLYVLRHDGTVIDSHGRLGRENVGELYKPWLCHTGDDDALLIADTVNNRLQVLDIEGHWSVVHTQPPLYKPDSAVYTPGRLYVTSWNSDKQQQELQLFLPRKTINTA